MRGLYLGDPAFSPVFDALEQRHAVMIRHPTSPDCLAQVGMGFPAPLVSPQPEQGAAEVLEEGRLYFDLALSATLLTLSALLQVTSLSHILFGTDYTFAPPPTIAGNTVAVGQLMDSLPPAQRRMVEYENAAELFPRLTAFLKTD